MSNLVHCNFCVHSQDEAKYIIAAPDKTYICEECIVICAEIVAQKEYGRIEYNSWFHNSEAK